MKIAFVLRELQWGIGEHTKTLAKYLKRLGVESEFFVGNTNLGTNALLLFNRLKGFDIVHVQGSPFGFFKTDMPKVTTVHTLLRREIQYEKKLSFFLGTFFEQRTLKTSDAIISVNHLIIKDLIGFYGVEKSKLHYIPNGLDLEEFGQEELPRENFILSCGRSVRRKQLSMIDDVCVCLGLPHVNIGRDRFVSRKELLGLYRRASILVCASEYETGAITVMEAMASGCPVVCTNIPELSNYVIDGETALTFTPRKRRELIDKILFLQGHLDLKGQMVKNARDLVRKRFDAGLLAKETVSVYNEVLK